MKKKKTTSTERSKKYREAMKAQKKKEVRGIYATEEQEVKIKAYAKTLQS